MRFLYGSGLFLLLPASVQSYSKGTFLCVPFFCDALRDDIWKISCFENGTLAFEIRVTFSWDILTYEKGI